MGEVDLELVLSLLNRLIDGQRLIRDDIAELRRRAGRMEQAMLALQRGHVDRLEGEVGVQDQIDSLMLRMQRVEERIG